MHPWKSGRKRAPTEREAAGAAFLPQSRPKTVTKRAVCSKVSRCFALTLGVDFIETSVCRSESKSFEKDSSFFGTFIRLPIFLGARVRLSLRAGIEWFHLNQVNPLDSSPFKTVHQCSTCSAKCLRSTCRRRRRVSPGKECKTNALLPNFVTNAP